MSLERITKRLKIISDLQEEVNKIKNLLDESLENDPQYQEIQESQSKVKEDTKVKKDKVMANPTIKKMQDEMKKIKDDIKDNRDALGQELADYYKESGSLEIVDEDGNTKRIVFSVRLVSN